MTELITALTFFTWMLSDVWIIRKFRKEELSPFLYAEVAPLALIVIHYLILAIGQTSLIPLLSCVIWVGVFRTLINFDGRINTITWGAIEWMRTLFRR